MGEILRNLRLLNKKSQKEVAETIKISAPAYFKYENGESKPTIENLIKLADYYGVTVDYLLGRQVNEFSYLTDHEKVLISDFRKLSTYNQAKILGEVAGILLTQN